MAFLPLPGVDVRALLVDSTGTPISGSNPSTFTGTVAGTTVAGGAVPFPVVVGMNGSGAVVRYLTTAAATFPNAGEQTLAVGPGVFDGSSWQSLKGNTDGSLPVGGFVAKSLTATPTITASTYTAGASLGGKLTLANATRIAAWSGTIQSITVSDLAKANNAIDFLFFVAGNPTSTTFTDHSTLDVDDGDLLNSRLVSFPSTAYTSLNDNSVGTLANIGLPFKLTTGTTLYAAAIARGTTSYASTSDLTFTFAIWPD
jgi:hypothetical protein